MATATGSNQSQRYAEFDEYIDYQLSKTRSRIRRTEILTAAVGVATLVLGYLFVFTILDHWVIPGGFGLVTRLIMLGLVAAGAAVWVAYRVILPSTRAVTGLYAAKTIEAADRKLKSSLLNIVDLKRARRAVPMSVAASMEKQAAVRLARGDVDQAIDRRLLMKLSYALLAVVGLCCLYAVLSPKEISFFRALTSSDRPVDTITELVRVEPGDVDVLAGSEVEVRVDLRGTIPEEVMLYYSSEDHQALKDEPFTLRPDEDNTRRFRGLMIGANGRGIVQNLRYHVVAGDAKSDEYRIHVIQPPGVTVNQVRYDFPEYTQFEPRTSLGGHIDALEGTVVTLTASANMPLKSAHVVLSDEVEFENRTAADNELHMEPVADSDQLEWTVSWPLEFRNSDGLFSRYYRIECRNMDAAVDPEPTVHNITIRPDRPPELELLDPVRDLSMPANAIVPLAIHARDPDFELRSLKVQLEKDGQPLDSPETIFDSLQPEHRHRQEFTGTHELHLTPRNLQAGDEVRFHVEARDNKTPDANITRTRPLKILITKPATPSEVQRQLDVDRRNQNSKFEQLQTDHDPSPTEDSADDEPAGNEGPQEPAAPDGSHPDTRSDPTSESDSAKRDAEPAGDSDSSDAPDAEQPDAASQSDDERPAQRPADDGEALQRLLEQLGASSQDEPSDQEDSDHRAEADDRQRQSGDQPESDQQGPEQQHVDSADGRSETGDEQGPRNDPDEAGPWTGESADQNHSESGATDSGDIKETAGGDGRSEQPGPGAGTPGEGHDGPTQNDRPGAATKPAEGEPKVDAGPDSTDTTGGTEQPAAPGENATQRQADGTETGIASPNHDPDADPARAQNPGDLKRIKDEPPALRDADPTDETHRKPTADGDPGENPSPSGRPPRADDQKNRAGDESAQRRPSTTSGDENRNPGQSETEPAPDRDSQLQPPDGASGTQGNENSSGSTNSATGKRNSSGRSEPGSREPGTNEPGEGEPAVGEPAVGEPAVGQPGVGQPGVGEPGGRPASDDGRETGLTDAATDDTNNRGPEKADPRAENASEDAPESDDGRPTGQRGTEPDSDEPSGAGRGESSEPGAGKPAGSESGGQSRSGTKGGTAGFNPGGGGNSGDDTRGANAQRPNGQPQANAEVTTPDPTEQNLEDARKAADLVLNRIEKDLQRGEVDQELLDDLGWTKDEMRAFAARLRSRLAQQKDGESPVERARRLQFEEVLKSLDLGAQGGQRTGTSDQDRSMESYAPSETPPPPRYRALFEAYKKSQLRGRRATGSRR